MKFTNCQISEYFCTERWKCHFDEIWPKISELTFREHSRSSKFNATHTLFYYCSIVTMTLYFFMQLVFNKAKIIFILYAAVFAAIGLQRQ